MNVILNSHLIEIEGEIIEKQVSPWSAKIGSGGTEFGNFLPCDIREYADLRGGLGLESEEEISERFYWANGVETTKDRYWTLGPLVVTAGAFNATPTKIIDFESITYAFSTGASWYWLAGTSTWTATGDASPLSTPTDAIVFKDETDTYLAVCNGSDVRYCATGYGGSQDWASLTTNDVKYMCAFDNKLYGVNSTGTTIYYSANGDINGTWASFNLSADYTAIQDMYTGKLPNDDPAIFLVAAEGLYAVDVWTQKVYKQEVRYPLTTMALCGMYWNASHYVGTGMGIAKIGQNLVSQFGPDSDDGLDTGYSGYIYDMVGTSHWVICCVSGSTYSSILKRHETTGGWHQIYTSSSNIRCLHYSPASLYSPGRLWFQDGSNIKYIQFPDLTHDVTKVANYTYAATGDLILPRFSKLSIIPKIAVKVEALSQSLTTTEKVTVYYRTDNNTDWTSLGEMTTNAHPTISFGSSLGTAFNDIQFKLTLVRGSTNTNTPKIRAFAFKYLALPDAVSAWQMTIRALGDRAKEIIGWLETARDATTLINFSPDADLNTSTKYVRVASMPNSRWLERNAAEKSFNLTVTEVE